MLNEPDGVEVVVALSPVGRDMYEVVEVTNTFDIEPGAYVDLRDLKVMRQEGVRVTIILYGRR